MLDYQNVTCFTGVDDKGRETKTLCVTNTDDNLMEAITTLFDDYTCPEDYKYAGVRGYEPMTAKEIKDEEAQDEALSDSRYIIDEKLDGVRALAHFYSQEVVDGESVGYARVFSRNLCKETGFYTENSDRLPQIRDIDRPEMSGTILDGEIKIMDRPFSDTSGMLNSLPERAWELQYEKGWAVLNAFDILYYKGINMRNLPLHRRKVYLHHAVEELNSPFIREVEYYRCGDMIPLPIDMMQKESFINNFVKSTDNCMNYPTLAHDLMHQPNSVETLVSAKGYYEYIVYTGGEGVMLKIDSGKYYHKRSKEYLKVKKFLTREVIILGFSEPTKEYKGKFPDPEKWRYWESYEGDLFDTSRPKHLEYVKNNPEECAPVSKYYFEDWVGNIRFGVIITPEEEKALSKKKKHVIHDMTIQGEKVRVIEVGECSGFDEKVRAMFTFGYQDPVGNVLTCNPNIEGNTKVIKHQHLIKVEWIGKVIELKANELFKDTGKMRHPRFLRVRYDKSPLQCTWEDHIL